jgi:alpha-tubulin suppressor-like RCC1 family protein
METRWLKTRKWIGVCALSALLQSCVSPNGDLPFDQLPGSGSNNPSNLNSFFWSGPATAVQGICETYVLNSYAANGVSLVAASPVFISIETSNVGSFYGDSACSGNSISALSLPTGSSAITVYFKAAAAGNFYFQAFAADYALSTLTVTTPNLAGPASQVVFTREPSTTANSGSAFTTQPVIQIQDASGTLVSSATNTIILSAFQDSACATPASSGTLSFTSFTSVAGTASFTGLSYTASSAATIFLKASSSGLASACSSSIIVSPAISMTALASASNSACAVHSTGDVYCWGDNTYGELGINSTTTTGIPTHVVGAGGTGFLAGVSKIAGGSNAFCAVTSGGNVYCWGNNSNGQLGNNSGGVGQHSSTPVEVVGVGGTGFLSNITSVSVGYEEACAVSSAGLVYCWGAGTNGQLGDGLTNDSDIPITVVSTSGTGTLTGVTAVSAGFFDTCAVASGNVYCWGLNSLGALGNNNQTSTTGVPVEVVGVGGTGFLSGINTVAVNSNSACAISGGLVLYCWGNSGNGQLGTGSTGTSATPVEVLGVGDAGDLLNILGVSIGISDSVCAYSTSGTPYCWGANAYGNLGNNSTTQETLPVNVLNPTASANFSAVSSISTGSHFSCAMSSGHGYCWGDNTFGELGQATTGGQELVPIEVVGEFGSGYL